MRLLFYSSSPWGIPIAESLLANGFSIGGVVTLPPRPAGRGQRLSPNPMENWAREKKLLVFTPEELNDSTLNYLKQRTGKVDIGVICVFGKILPSSWFAFPRWGTLNLHPSLLPAYQGPAPVVRAILAGEQKTGVSIIQINEKVDQGPILAQVEVKIRFGETAGELSKRLFAKGSVLLIEVLQKIASGKTLSPIPPKVLPSWAPKIKKEETELKEDSPIDFLWRQVLAFNPQPGAWCWLKIEGEKKRLKIWQATKTKTHLLPIEVQLEGRRRVSWEQFVAGWGSRITKAPRFLPIK